MSYSPPPTAASASKPRRPAWRTFLWIVAVALIALLIGFILSRCAGSPTGAAGGSGPGGASARITVGVARAALGDVPITLSALGTVTPQATSQVVPRVSGPLIAVNFKEGQMVRAGATLAQIDPAPFQASVEQAQGQLARDQASLVEAKLDLKRYQDLLAENSIASQQVDIQAATVKQDEGTVTADRGSLKTAELNLSYTRLAAPVTGRVGLRQIDVGNQVAANQATPIAVVTKVNPIDVVFAIPEDAIPSLTRHPSYGAGLPVTAYDRSGGQALAQGHLTAVDNVVDTTTGTVKGKATFDNGSGALFPNQFVNVSVLTDTLAKQVITPTTAIRHGPQGDFVFVLQPGQIVRVRLVKTGPGTGETTSIASGLNAGEVVITEGGDRLTDCAQVNLPGRPAGGGGGHHQGGHAGGFGGGPPQNFAAGRPGAGQGCPAAGGGGHGGHHGMGGKAAGGTSGGAPGGGGG